MKYNYRWKLADANFTKDKGKVFSCFACTGGSTMGYKLAGFDVIGFNEIDMRMGSVYVKNHKPKYQFIEAIQEFVKWNEFPDDLFNLDILDGSPPCSSFSMSGNREKDWGKKKKFKEGQKEQVLDGLFFHFIELARILQPKVVVAENVQGILQGAAVKYARKIISEFNKANYEVKEFSFNAKDMGVPQSRQRVFFIAIRKDLAKQLPQERGKLFSTYPALQFNFNELAIPFQDIRSEGNQMPWTQHDQRIWDNRKQGDSKYSCVLERIENRCSNFNAKFVHADRLVSTLAASEGSKMTLFDEPRRMNIKEMTLAQSFPLDFDFMTDKATKIQYMLGMSVPPVMMANIAHEIRQQWDEIF